MPSDKVRLALMDLYKSAPNQGMRCLKEYLDGYSRHIEYDVFDVRSKNEVPGTEYDIYISSGGPGHPLEGNGIWDPQWYELIDSLWQHNMTTSYSRKYAFFICHSFQMACHHFNLGSISKRKTKSFGILPVHKTQIGKEDWLLDGLADIYYVVDSRQYQVLQPDLHVFEEHHADILSIENIHTRIEDEKAIMAVRFSNEFMGTQFHPEADPDGMKEHFQKRENRDFVVMNYGEKGYEDMMDHIDDPDKLRLTHNTVVPNFLDYALSRISDSVKTLDV